MTPAATTRPEPALPDELLGTPVDVYRNLHADTTADALSVRSRETETYGRVITHSPSVLVHDPEFVIQPGGLERYRESGVKNVHAFVRGYVAERAAWPDDAEVRAVTYNPEHYDSFVTRGTERPVNRGQIAHVTEDGVWVVDPSFDE